MIVGISLLDDALNGRSGWVAGFYYVRNCLSALASIAPADVPPVTLLVPEALQEELVFADDHQALPWLNVVRVSEETLSDRRDGGRLQQFLEAHAFDVVFPVVTVPHVSPHGRTLGWIPDYQHHHYPDFFAEDERRIREELYQFLVGFCDRIVCSSPPVEEDLYRFYPQARGKGVLLPFASWLPRSAYEGSPRATLKRLDIEGKYIYLPGQFWVHKNHRLVFEAWKRLKARGHEVPLVCTGRPADHRFSGHYAELIDFLAKENLEGVVRLLGFVSRDDQIQLYRGAAAVLQPSLFEGWSTSVEEAKTLGKRIIASDIPVHRAQCQGDALYFDGNSPGDLLERIQGIWDRLPPGHDAAAESAARDAARTRLQQFGRALVRAWEEVSAEAGGSHTLVGPQVARLNRLVESGRREADGLRDQREILLGNIETVARQLKEMEGAAAERLEKMLLLHKYLDEAKAELHALRRRWPVRVLRLLRIVPR